MQSTTNSVLDLQADIQCEGVADLKFKCTNKVRFAAIAGAGNVRWLCESCFNTFKELSSKIYR